KVFRALRHPRNAEADGEVERRRLRGRGGRPAERTGRPPGYPAGSQTGSGCGSGSGGTGPGPGPGPGPGGPGTGGSGGIGFGTGPGPGGTGFGGPGGPGGPGGTGGGYVARGPTVRAASPALRNSVASMPTPVPAGSARYPCPGRPLRRRRPQGRCDPSPGGGRMEV